MPLGEVLLAILRLQVRSEDLLQVNLNASENWLFIELTRGMFPANVCISLDL